MLARGLLAACLAVVGAAWGTSASAAPEMVAFSSGYYPGTIIVNTRERRLYFVLGGGTAIRYQVGVGKAGKQWAGTSQIDGKYTYPAWSPPPDMLRGRAPFVIPGGAPQNPMGIAALTLANTEFAIHGTNAPASIGGFVSNGCIRMHNQDIADLFQRVQVGTPVVVAR